MEAHNCKVWQFDRDPDSLKVHLKFNGGSTATIKGLAIERAIKREYAGGRVSYAGHLVRDQGVVLSLDRRTEALWIILPAEGNHPSRAVVILNRKLERLRTAMVKAKHERGQKRNNSNGHG